MQPFDYNKYLKNNPLLKESVEEATSITTVDDITATLASDSTKKITIPKGSKVKVLIKRMPKEPKVTQLDYNGEKVNVNAGPFIQQYLSEDLNEFDATSFFQGQMIQQAMQAAPQAMTEADKIITYVLMTVGIGAVAGGLAAVAKDRLGSLNPIPAIKQWWADRQKRKALEPIVAKLKKDPEVMKYVANRNMKGIQAVIKSKLSPEEQKYIGSLTRDALSESTLGEAAEKDIEVGIDSAEQITLKGKELDSDKLGTNKKYRDIILKAPDKAFMYKGKPVSITAVDLNDGSVDEPKIYLTVLNESTKTIQTLKSTKPGDKLTLVLDDDSTVTVVRVGTNKSGEPTFKHIKNNKEVGTASALSASHIKSVK
jgi:hypothetical protein